MLCKRQGIQRLQNAPNQRGRCVRGDSRNCHKAGHLFPQPCRKVGKTQIGRNAKTAAGREPTSSDLERRGYSLEASLAGFKVRVYQMSATVGRGYVAEHTIF